MRTTRPDDLAAAVIRRLLEKYPAVSPDEIDDVILGCANPEGESGMNMARVAALRAGLPDAVPGVTINRFCSSGLQAIAMAADRIRSGSAQIMIAGGAESMSMIPMSGYKFAPNPWMVDHMPQIYMGMGLTAEEVQRKYDVSREDSDQFAYRSHQNALRAQAEGKFDDEIVPVDVEANILENGAPHQHNEHVFKKDEGPRADTSRGSAGEIEAGISREWDGDGRQFVANERWRGCGAGDVGEESQRAGSETDGAFCEFRGRRRSSGDHGHRTGGGDSESADAGRVEDGRHRRRGIERSFRRASAGGDSPGRA